MAQKHKRAFRPDSMSAYFRQEWLPLTFITLSGLLYNVGLLAGPWFEGRMAQCLADILGGNQQAAVMTLLVLGYIVVTLLVQASRFIKRYYVRRFANNINRRMKGVLYANLVRQRIGARGCGRTDDQGHFRRGRLRGGYAQVHHGGLRYGRGAGGLCRHAVRL